MRRRDHDAILAAAYETVATLETTIDHLRGDLEAERAYSRRLLEQVAGIYSDIVPDPSEEVTARHRQQLTDAIVASTQAPGQAGPLPPTPTQWAMPEEPDPSTFEDPIDLSEPWDALPADPIYNHAWGMDEQVPLAEPVPEGQREKIVGIAVGEDPFKDLGIKREDL